MSSVERSTTRSELIASARGVYNEFNKLAELIQDTYDRRALEFWREDLIVLWDRAKHLHSLNLEEVHPIVANQLKIVLSQPPEQWFLFWKMKGQKKYND